jgi:hypothetical protein
MSPRRLLPVAAVLCVLAADALACPNCKDAVAPDPAAAGFNNAIYFALATLFSIVGLLGWRVGKAVRRADAAQD